MIWAIIATAWASAILGIGAGWKLCRWMTPIELAPAERPAPDQRMRPVVFDDEDDLPSLSLEDEDQPTRCVGNVVRLRR